MAVSLQDNGGPLGFSIFVKGEEKIKEFLEIFESQHMKWLDEILEVAKNNFGREDVKLLPKTPCAKNRSRRVRKAARRSTGSPATAVAEEIPAKRSRASARQAVKQQPAQPPISEFYKDALSSAAPTSPPVATPPTKKVKEEPKTPESSEHTIPSSVEVSATPPDLPGKVKEEPVVPETEAEVESAASARPKRSTRGTRASTRASTARQAPKTRVAGKRQRGPNKSSIEDSGMETAEAPSAEREEAPNIATAAKKRKNSKSSNAGEAVEEKTAGDNKQEVSIKTEQQETEAGVPKKKRKGAKASKDDELVEGRSETKESVKTDEESSHTAQEGDEPSIPAKKQKGGKTRKSKASAQDKSLAKPSDKEEEDASEAEKAAPPSNTTRPVRASSRAATRASSAQTATRASTRSRLASKTNKEAPTTGRAGRRNMSRLCTKVSAQTAAPSTPKGSRYKDHVKRLIQLHEGCIAGAQTTGEPSSPNRSQTAPPPSSPHTPTSTVSHSPYRSSPITSIQVSSKQTTTPTKAAPTKAAKKPPPATPDMKGKKVLGKEKAKEVSAFFEGLKSTATRGSVIKTPARNSSRQKETESKQAAADLPKQPEEKVDAAVQPREASPPKEIEPASRTPPKTDIEEKVASTDSEAASQGLPQTDVAPASEAAADSTVLSQDSLEEIQEDERDEADGSHPAEDLPKLAYSTSSASSSAMDEDSLMEEKSVRPRRSTRASSRRSSIASQSKRRTSTYLRLHPGRQSVRKSDLRRSKRMSIAHTRAAVAHMERDSLEPQAQQPVLSRRSPRLAQKLDLDEEEETRTGSSSSSSSCGSDDIIDKTPSPECPPSKVIRPHPRSFLNAVNKKKRLVSTPGTPGNVITSFIQRNTPQKKSIKEQQEERRAQLLEKQKKEESHRRRMADEKKKNLEEQRRLREERMRKAAQAREQFHQQRQERKQKIQERDEHKQTLTERQKEDRKKEELQKRQQYEKKKAEVEERRKQEQEAKIRKLKEQEEEEKRHQRMLERKREYEELERQRRAEDARRQAEQQKLRQERQRLEEIVKKREQTLAREREQQRLREERDREKKELERRRQQEAEQREKERRAREEAERLRKIAQERALREKQREEEEAHLKTIIDKEKAQREHERLKANILKLNTSHNQQHNTSAVLNSTFNKDKVENSPQSYDLTPQRIYVAASEENYGIDDMHSDDSTDDEEAPKKKIPSWAQGGALKTALINQHYHPPDFAALFPMIEPPNLEVMFVKKRARFNKRTSSAVWDSPIINHLR